MRVNYQGLLNQTLGAVGSTASILKFLHSQDPKVIKEREIETLKETDARRAEELKARRGTAVADIIATEGNYKPDKSSIESLSHTTDNLTNKYGDLKELSSRIFDLEPTQGSYDDREIFDKFGTERQRYMQQQLGDRMASSVFEKMITTKDQEEAFRLRKEYLADRAKRGPNAHNLPLERSIKALSKKLPRAEQFADRRIEEAELAQKGVKKK